MTRDIYRTCELCGNPEPQFLLDSDRLDGPLVKCTACGLVFVGSRREDFAFQGADPVKSARLSSRVHELGLSDRATDEAEARWQEMTAGERLRDLQRYQSKGRLLEIGCAEGLFLTAALAAGFQAIGLEADIHSSSIGRNRGLDIKTGTLSDIHFEPGRFEVVAMYHVIEHLDSPRVTLNEVARILPPDGLLALETPNVDTIWFEVLGHRWRQLIPDHYFFFSPRTIGRLLEDCGFQVCRVTTVGKPMSLRLFLDRIRRLNSGVGQMAMAIARATHTENITLRVNLRDIIRIHARRGRSK